MVAQRSFPFNMSYNFKIGSTLKLLERSPKMLHYPVSCQLFLEDIAQDLQKADPEWRIILLRYFNPVGAHESGMLGEDPKGIPNNLMPYITQVAVGRLPELNVYGHDYPTPDGSAVSWLI